MKIHLCGMHRGLGDRVLEQDRPLISMEQIKEKEVLAQQFFPLVQTVTLVSAW